MRSPEVVKDEIESALNVAQFVTKQPKDKPWRGEGAGVLEILEGFRGDTYRAVYTVQFQGAVYVRHAFQKKSPCGIRTAHPDVELIGGRRKLAKQDYEARYGKNK